jgi:anti-sigma factor RsiW
MTCEEYLDYVAGDVDGTLGEGAASVRSHLAGCARCRLERERQQAVRDLLRSRRLSPELPIEIRSRLLASLRESCAGGRGALRARRWIGGVGATMLAAAAMAVVIVAVLWSRSGPLSPLIREYQLASRGALKMTLATGSRKELEDLYRKYGDEGIAAHVVDLSPAGFQLVGGALEDFPGRRARITVYTDGEHLVLCDYFRAAHAGIDAAADGQPSFFRERGLTFRVRRVGDHLCILVTRMPIEMFRRRMGDASHSG